MSDQGSMRDAGTYLTEYLHISQYDLGSPMEGPRLRGPYLRPRRIQEGPTDRVGLGLDPHTSALGILPKRRSRKRRLKGLSPAAQKFAVVL